MPPRSFAIALSLVAGVLAACVGSPEPGPSNRTLAVVTGAPFMPEELPSTAIGAGADVQAVAAQGERVVVAIDDAVAAPVGDELRAVPVLADPGEPDGTGAVHALARRADGFFVSADNGLFHTFDGRLLLSPLSAALAGADVRALTAVGTGAEEALWIATADELLHVAGGTVEHLSIAGAPCPASAVAALDAVVLVACSQGLYELDPETGTALRAPDGLGDVTAIEDAGDGWAAVATSTGLVLRDPAGAYTRYSLDDEPTGETGTPVDALTSDPVIGVVASTVAGLLRAGPGAAPVGITSLPPSHERRIAIDGWGTIWVGDGAEVRSVPLGSPVGFASDVAPFFETWCNDCHASGANGAPKHDFTDYDTVATLLPAILIRLAQGSMPPSGARPSDEDVELLQRWARTGMSP